MDGYKRLSLLWPAMCESVRCIPVELKEGKIIALPLVARGDVGETKEAVAGNVSALA
jgi:hypothetical protein